ncbi:MAG TPA: PQQ-binding-like beta-propeller repeat protein [Candidatus Acidoferrales bacterium]
MNRRVPVIGAVSAAIIIFVLSRTDITRSAPKVQSDWPVYGGDSADTHYSPLDQINRSNVSKLQIAWTYDSGEPGGMETSPIVVGNVLYTYTPSKTVVALDAATGKVLWKFDAGLPGGQTVRGLTYWTDGKDSRIFAGILSYVYALDAETGQPIKSFGSDGRIDLREGLGREPTDRQSVFLTSPGIIYKDLLITGGRNPEALPAPPGDIRAYDVHTGAVRWQFHTIPHPGEPGYETWPKDAWTYEGAANNWPGMAVDQKRGIVFVPTGSAATDFLGMNRIGNDLYANCELALNAATGKLIWYFQAVHHDLWDRDFPSPPTLVTVKHNGKMVDAVAQTTKHGVVFLFNRETGEPLFPIENKKYPPSTVPGEVASPEQPMPTKPAPFARQLLTEDMLTNRTPEAHAWAVEQFKTFRSEGQFVPLSIGKDTVVFPGFDGGAEWGGSAADPHGILYVNSNDIAWTGALAENMSANSSPTRALYLSQCAACHQDNLQGQPPDFPSLIGVGSRLTADQITTTIRTGKGRMPAFSGLTDDQVSSLVQFLMTGGGRAGRGRGRGGATAARGGQVPAAPPSADAVEFAQSGPAHASAPASDPNDAQNLPYRFTGYKKFYDPDGYPAVAPPWGTLNAINLNTGEYLWKIPLGEYPALVAQGVKNTGSENYGGPIVTAGGLVFIAATNYDKKIRAFDKDTGKLLWEATLPYSGNATPVTYMVNGRQYVVIAATGAKGDPKLGPRGVYVAFALPK